MGSHGKRPGAVTDTASRPNEGPTGGREGGVGGVQVTSVTRAPAAVNTS